MASTSNYGWETPDDTDYVYQGAAAARLTANSIDTTLDGLAQKWVINTKDTSAVQTVTTTTTTALFSAPTFSPQADRVYLVNYGIGFIQKSGTNGQIIVSLRADTAAGGTIDAARYDGQIVGNNFTFNKTTVLSGISVPFVPVVCVQGASGGFVASNSGSIPGFISIVDIGSV
jgi:hypothetical protein